MLGKDKFFKIYNRFGAGVKSKDSVRIYFLFSYILMLVVPLIVSGYIHLKSLDKYDEQIGKANEAQLRLFQQTVDSRIMEVRSLVERLALDVHIQKLLNTQSIDNSFQRYEIKDMIDNMELFTVTNQIIRRFYIYFKKSNTVITNNVITDLPSLFYVQQIETLNFDQWKDAISKINLGNFTIFNKSSLSYLQSLPIGELRDSSGTIVVDIDIEKLRQQISNFEVASEGHIFIIGENHEILFSSKPDVNIDQEYLNNDDYMDKDIIVYDKDQKVITKLKSALPNIQYVSVVSKEISKRSFYYMRNLAVVGFLICIAIGSLLVLVFTKKSYNPLKEIIQIFKYKHNNLKPASVNEYELIKSLVSNTINEKEKILEQNEIQQKVLKYNFLYRLITGKTKNYTEVQDALELYDINFRSDCFALILFCLEDYSNLFYESNHDRSETVIQIVHFIMRNVIEELISKENVGFLVEVDEFLVAVVNFDDQPEGEKREKILSIVQQAKEFIEKNFAILFSVAISDIHYGFTGLPRCYQECIETIEYKQLMSAEDIVFYQEIREKESDGIIVGASFDQQQQFMSCIKVCDYEAARVILNEMISDDIKFKVPIDIVKCRMFSTINLMLNAMSEISITCEPGFLEQLNMVERLLNCQTVKELHDQINMMLKEVDEYTKGRKKQEHQNIVSSILNYVEQNYWNVNLSVSMLADHLKMNTPYLSKFFRKQYGMGLLDYIHKFRISKAKILMKDSSISIKAVSEKVGYCDSDAFIRVFKKYEGVTPGKYREI